MPDDADDRMFGAVSVVVFVSGLASDRTKPSASSPPQPSAPAASTLISEHFREFVAVTQMSSTQSFRVSTLDAFLTKW